MVLTLLKNALKSKTIWGLIVSALGKSLQVYGVDLSPEMQDQMVVEIINLIPHIMEWGGYLFAGYGRVVAKQSLVDETPKVNP